MKLPPLESLHHTYICTAPTSEAAAVFANLMDQFVAMKMFESTDGNPDVVRFDFRSVGVDDVKGIAEFNSRVALSGRKVAIITAEQITQPAQNALLKIIEEPNPGTYFFFILPSISQVLPTVLSRAHTIDFRARDHHPDPKKTLLEDVENFINHKPGDRMALIKEITTFLEKEKMTRGQVCEFISGVVATFHDQNKGKLTQSQLRAMISVEQYMRDPSSSMKLCLEQLALAL